MLGSNRRQNEVVLMGQILPKSIVGVNFYFHVLYFLLILSLIIYVEFRSIETSVLYSLICQFFAAFLVPFAFGYSFRKFKSIGFVLPNCLRCEYKSKALYNWKRSMRFFQGSLYMIPTSILVATISTYTMYRGTEIPNIIRVNEICALLVIFMCSAWAGVGLYAVLSGCHAVSKLGRYKIQIEPHDFSVQYIGNALSKCFVFIGVIWTFYLGSLIGGSEFGAHLATSNLTISALWVGGTLMFLVTCFLYAIYPLHRRILEFKRNHLSQIDKHLAYIHGDDWSAMDENKVSQVQFLQEQQKRIASLPNWPFRKGAMYNVFFSSFLSAIPGLINVERGVAAVLDLE